MLRMDYGEYPTEKPLGIPLRPALMRALLEFDEAETGRPGWTMHQFPENAHKANLVVVASLSQSRENAIRENFRGKVMLHLLKTLCEKKD